jgi:acyl-CoA-dependent ceramide synthase
MAAKEAFPQADNGFATPFDSNWALGEQQNVPPTRTDSLKPYGSCAPESGVHRLVVKRAKKKSKDESLTATLCTLICEHQIGISGN